VEANGVVDPIRMPAGIARRWGAVPPVARLFLGLAVLAYGIELGPWIATGEAVRMPLTNLLELLTAGPLARAALVALPAALLLRRPDAAAAARPMFLGAAVVALTAFPYQESWFAPAVRFAFEDDIAYSNAWLVVSTTGWIVGAAGWLMVAYGLRRMEARPSRTVAVLAAGGAVLYAGAWLIGLILSYGRVQLFDSGLGPAELLDYGARAIPVVAGAAMVWCVFRVAGDARRPARARALGVAAEVVLMTGPALALLPELDLIDRGILREWLSVPIGQWATIALVVAFALGLADPRARAATSDEASAESRYFGA